MLPPRSALTVPVAVSLSPSTTVTVALSSTLPLARLMRLLSLLLSTSSGRWSSSADWVSVTVPSLATLMRNTSPALVEPTMSLPTLVSVMASPLLVSPLLLSVTLRL
ncbi:hypothetical protein D3C72_2161010 [compost metagenome]